MRLVLSSKAEKQFRKLPKTDQIILASKLRKIGGTKKNLSEEKLSGFSNAYRIRVGDYRIVYKKTAHISYVVLIGHRREIYKMLKRLFG